MQYHVHSRRQSYTGGQRSPLHFSSSATAAAAAVNAVASTSPLPRHPQQQQQHKHQHQRTNTVPDAPTLLRLPSSSTTSSHSHSQPQSQSQSHSQQAAPIPTRTRRATTTGPSTPILLIPNQPSGSSATSPTYFSPHHPSTSSVAGKEPRSPGNGRSPAWNTSGIDNSRGPPITLITRGIAADTARRPQKPSRPADFAFAQQQLLQSGLVSPGIASNTSTGRRSRRSSVASIDSSQANNNNNNNNATRTNTNTNTITTNTPRLSRHNSHQTTEPEQYMAHSPDDYSDYSSGARSHPEEVNMDHGKGVKGTAGNDGEQGEDLFLNIASDTAREHALRSDRLRSRLARPSNRQSFPTASSAQSNTTTQQPSRLPSATDAKSTATQYRRASAFSTVSRAHREQSPMSPAPVLDTPRTYQNELSPKRSFSVKKDTELSPHQFLSQLSSSRRRPSNPEVTHTPPNRTSTYRPSNLNYSTPRAQPETPQAEARQETASRVDGTESLDSTGAATSVWDELDELKTRIRRIELGGKIPATSGAVVANATERPRTANTSVTTVSSSPKQQRKNNASPPESTAGTSTPQRTHPLLRDALAKARKHVAPPVYRSLEATATEALELAELTGSAGPQGNLQTVSSVLHGASISDRQIRRKADSICRSLTELCIELCDNKSSIASPAIRSINGAPTRRLSVQINGAESPTIRPSIEEESDTIPRNSPSRAMSRIEARRTSLMAGNLNGSPREASYEPLTPSQSGIPTRLSRAGTSLQRARRRDEEEDDDDPTLRVPSRAMTDFRDIRASANHTKRFSREYTSREQLQELQPGPALQQHTSSLRRPTISGAENNSLLYQDDSRFHIERRRTPGYEKPLSADLGSRLVQPTTNYSAHRASLGAQGLGRNTSVSRRVRTNAGE